MVLLMDLTTIVCGLLLLVLVIVIVAWKLVKFGIKTLIAIIAVIILLMLVSAYMTGGLTAWFGI